MSFMILTEIVDVKEDLITLPIHVKIDSINSFKSSQMGSFPATQVMLHNDCVWVTETPDVIEELIESKELPPLGLR